MSRTAATVAIAAATLAIIATLVPSAQAQPSQPSRSLTEDAVAWWNIKEIQAKAPENFCSDAFGPIGYIGSLFPTGKTSTQCAFKAGQPLVIEIVGSISFLGVTSFTGYPFLGFAGLTFDPQSAISAATGLSLTIDGKAVPITSDLRTPTNIFPVQPGEAQGMWFAGADGYFYRTSFEKGTHTVHAIGCAPACSDITYALYIK